MSKAEVDEYIAGVKASVDKIAATRVLRPPPHMTAAEVNNYLAQVKADVDIIANLRLGLEILYWTGFEALLLVLSIFVFYLTWQVANNNEQFGGTAYPNVIFGTTSVTPPPRHRRGAPRASCRLLLTS